MLETKIIDKIKSNFWKKDDILPQKTIKFERKWNILIKNKLNMKKNEIFW